MPQAIIPHPLTLYMHPIRNLPINLVAPVTSLLFQRPPSHPFSTQQSSCHQGLGSPSNPFPSIPFLFGLGLGGECFGVGQIGEEILRSAQLQIVIISKIDVCKDCEFAFLWVLELSLGKGFVDRYCSWMSGFQAHVRWLGYLGENFWNSGHC